MAQNGLTSFVPSKHGFHFCNAFTNNVISGATANAVAQSLGLPANLFPATLSSNLFATNGRCGGMAWLSLDYYFASADVPTAISSYSKFHRQFDDFGSSAEVPPDGTPLADWIYKRLIDSFLNCGVQAVSWVAGYDHNTWFFGGIPEMTTSNEFPKLQTAIDTGMPVVLCLISWPSDVSTCHQVVAYGYQVDAQGNMTVNIYDNRYADDDTVTMTAAPNQHWTIQSSDSRVSSDTWKGWFVEGYSAQPPPFLDLLMAAPISGLSGVINGQPATYTFSVTNGGKSPAHPTAFRIVGATSFGEQFVLGPMAWPPSALAPGATAEVAVSLPIISFPQGVDQTQSVLQAQFQTLEGWWDPVGATADVPNTLTISMIPGLSAYIDVINTTLGIDVINGVKTAIASVTCTASATGFGQTPAFTWGADGTGNLASGATATLRLNCGTTGNIVRTHTISVTATGPIARGGTGSAAASIQLTVNPLLVHLAADYADSVTTPSGISSAMPVNGGGGGGITVTRYSKVEVEASTSGGFGTIGFAWQPASIAPTVPGKAMAPAPPLPASTELVTVTVTDEMFESATGSVLVQFDVVSGRPVPNRVPTRALRAVSGQTFAGGDDPLGQLVDARTFAAPIGIDPSRALAVISAPRDVPPVQRGETAQAEPAAVEKGAAGNGQLVASS